MKNWIPQSTDIDIFANIVRIKQARDMVQHKPFEVSDAEFNRIVPLFEKPLLALGVPKEKIKNKLTMRIKDEEAKITLQKYEQSKVMMQKYEQSQTSFNHNFIPPVANFFSRDEELDELHDKMIKDFRLKLGTVLSGFPGVGKSETARKYWMKYGQSLYEDIIVWVNAENEATMESEFQDIGDECGISKIKKPDGNYVETKKLVDLVYRHFAAKVPASTRKVLFVFDGADDQNVLYQFLPKSIDYAPYILITSQCTIWDNRFNHLELQVFNSKDALQFFTENISKNQYANEEQIEELLSELSCHPLALQQALSYIHKNSTTVDRYMSLLNQHKMKMLSESAEQVGHPSVNSTMTISIDRLRGLDEDAINLLGVLAHLDGKEIKKGFLLMFFDNDEFKLNKILSVLRKYSIVNFDTSINDGVEFGDQVIRIHFLTQCFLESNQNKKIRSKKLKKVAHVFIEDLKACKKAAKPQDGKLWLNHFYKICENDFKKSSILNSFVNSGQELLQDLLLTRGNHSMLSELFEYICEQQKQIHGEKNLVYLTTRTFLAECFDQIGQRQKALNIIEDTIKSQLEIIGPLDLCYLKSKNVLANCLVKGTNDEVERALQIYIEIKEALTVTNDDDLYIRTSHHIAYCFMRKGEHGKAIQILKEVEEVQLKTLGSTNSEYLKTKQNLAMCYSEAKKSALAIQLLKEVVEVQLKTFGSTNSEYLKTKHNLAMCYSKVKKFALAIQLLKEVVEVQLKTLGPTNSEYLKTKHNLALCYRDTKEFDLAIQLLKEVEKVQLKTLEPTNSEYLETKHYLALCYSDTKEFDLAIQLLKEVEKVQLKTLGPTSSEYLTTKQNLALCYSDTKKFNLAIQLLKEVEKVQLKTLGQTNSEYLTTKQNLALCYSNTKEFNLAFQLLKEIVEVQFKTFGSTNSKYLETKRELAMCYSNAKKFNLAIQLLKEVEEVQFKTLGPTNSEYLKTKRNLVFVILQCQSRKLN